MASKSRNKHSTLVVKRKHTCRDGSIKLVTVCYLSQRDEENGLDSQYYMQGYIVEAL